MSFSQRLQEIREGFEPAFWVANFTEIFERVAYYGTTAVLAIYLNEQLHFSSELTGSFVGLTGFVVWFLPILGGTLADRFGFRRALMFSLPGNDRRIFPARLACSALDAAATSCPHRQMVGGLDHPDDSGARPRRREALRSWNDGASFERKCSVDRLFDLLHAREHRRRCRTDHGICGPQEDGLGRRKCVPRRLTQCVPDVLGHAFLLPRADTLGRSTSGQRIFGDQEYVRRAPQPAICHLS